MIAEREQRVRARQHLPSMPIKCPRCGDETHCGIFRRIENDINGGEIAPDRLLCKWCGYYYSRVNGLLQCEPNPRLGWWDVRGDPATTRTPYEISRNLPPLKLRNIRLSP
jgi:hypothetical protein